MDKTKKPSAFSYLVLLVILILMGAAVYYIAPPIVHKVLVSIGWYDEENPL